MNTTSAIDAVVHLLETLGWSREPDLIVQGRADRPVFRHRQHKTVVGPLWVTYYRLVKETILDQDSLRTEDFEAVETKLRELTK